MALIPLRNRLKETVKFSSFIGSFVGLIGGMITTGIVAGITGIPFIGLPTIASAVGTSYGLTKLAIVLGIIFGSAFTGGLVVFASCLVIAALIGVGYGVFQHFAATNNEEMNEEIPVVVIGLEDGRDVADVAAEENVEPAIEPLPEPELEPEPESKPQEQVQAMKEEEPVSSASSQEPPSSPSTAGSENSASDDESSQSEKEEDLQPPPEKVSDDVPHTDIPEQPQPTSSPAVIMQALGVQLSSPSPQVASTAVVVETSVPSATTHEPEPEPVLDPMFDPRYQEQNWSLIM